MYRVRAICRAAGRVAAASLGLLVAALAPGDSGRPPDHWESLALQACVEDAAATDGELSLDARLADTTVTLYAPAALSPTARLELARLACRLEWRVLDGGARFLTYPGQEAREARRCRFTGRVTHEASLAMAEMAVRAVRFGQTAMLAAAGEPGGNGADWRVAPDLELRPGWLTLGFRPLRELPEDERAVVLRYARQAMDPWAVIGSEAVTEEQRRVVVRAVSDGDPDGVLRVQLALFLSPSVHARTYRLTCVGDAFPVVPTLRAALEEEQALACVELPAQVRDIALPDPPRGAVTAQTVVECVGDACGAPVALPVAWSALEHADIRVPEGTETVGPALDALVSGLGLESWGRADDGLVLGASAGLTSASFCGPEDLIGPWASAAQAIERLLVALDEEQVQTLLRQGMWLRLADLRPEQRQLVVAAVPSATEPSIRVGRPGADEVVLRAADDPEAWFHLPMNVNLQIALDDGTYVGDVVVAAPWPLD